MIHLRYLRNRHYARLRYSRRFKQWLSDQASRLKLTEEELFNKIKNERLTSSQVEQLTITEPPVEG